MDWSPPFRAQALSFLEFYTASGDPWKVHEPFPPSRSRSKLCYSVLLLGYITVRDSFLQTRKVKQIASWGQMWDSLWVFEFS